MGKIYTKKGDKGFTFLFNGKKIRKDSLRTKAYGAIDELNSLIGFVISFLKDKKIKEELVKVQDDLFVIGGELAFSVKINKEDIEKRILRVESLIDELEDKLPKLTSFILPGGGNAGSLLQFTRAVCRRAERDIISLSKKQQVNNQVIAYLNRLSDFFFVLSRYINLKEKKKETTWKIKKQWDQ